jgi:5-methylcytosine-specific restriction enzyme A
MRSVSEWIGKTDNAAIPPRVRLRQFERDGGVCQCGCGIRIRAGDKWETDHRVAVINGGPNREGNLRTLLTAHHKIKSREDMATKSKNYKVRSKHLGLQAKRKPFPGSRASGLRKKMDGTVERRS